ncbi:MAG TPA: hypothetical protein VGY13_12955 [Solirubrobacteraceae bacterium]|nr:hypothetical protein [Solirubrobacteraceae bacterium]
MTKASAKVLKPRKGQKPTISGAAQDGQVLAATTGSWHGTAPFAFSYQWEACAKRRCRPIAGATEADYRADTEQLGHTLKVIVTAANSRGHTSAASKPTAAVVAGPPVSVGQPTVSGTPAPGETLEASTGEWAGTAPISYRYQWLSCPVLGECFAIAGATSSTYTVQALELASTIEVAVTASNAHGEASASSTKTVAVHAILPHLTQLPSIVGELLDGQLLKALVGAWTGTGPISYSYRWELCDQSGENCRSIAEALASGLQVVSDFVGKTLRVAVTATNEAGSTTAVSEPSTPVQALAPIDRGLPSIGGLLQDGQRLSALAGSWEGTGPLDYNYQWQLCDANGENCKSISEALASGLSLISSFVGKTLRVAVTATNEAGSTTAVSEPSTPVQALAPIDRGLPSITGLLRDGQSLAAQTGNWEGTGPLDYSYQWQLCDAAGVECKGISEALASGLSLISSFVGKTLRVAVTATNEAGSTTAVSPASTPVQALAPIDRGLPAIGGTLVDGQQLSASAGSWEGTGPLSYSYQWQLCNAAGVECKGIAEALGSGLPIRSGFVGKTLRVAVTATNEAGSATAVSEPSGSVRALAPSNAGLPSISGNLVDGQRLSALVGSWEGTGPLDYSYQWQLCNAAGVECKSIAEALASGLSLISGDVGRTLRVAVTASNEAGSATALSEPSTPVQALAPIDRVLPSITGLLRDGQRLAAQAGTWEGTGPLAYSYQWQLCDSKGEDCNAISEALAPSLALISGWIGKTVRVAVTASNEAGSTTALSPVSGSVAASPPSSTQAPSIEGAFEDGQTLTAETGSWSGTGPLDFTYAWELCNASGAECASLVGATEATLQLVSSDVGKTVRVTVTASNEAGSASATSPAGAPIVPAPPTNLAIPPITGALLVGATLSAGTGRWAGTTPMSFGYQWEACGTLGLSCTKIGGASEPTLKLSLEALGQTFRVQVTASNVAGTRSAHSLTTIAVVL